MTDVLSLRGFGVAFGPTTVLVDVALDVPRVGVTALVGPAGSGKSTLLRTIAGLNDAHPALATWGEARFADAPLASVRAPRTGEPRQGIAFVVQHARFYIDTVRESLASALPNRAELERAAQTRVIHQLLERHGLGELAARLDEDVTRLTPVTQRRLALVRALASEPLLLLADEPTAGLPPEGAEQVIALLRRQGERGAVLWVSHNQRHVRAGGGRVALLAGGFIQEITPIPEFFDAPASEAGASFIRTGGCLTPTAGATRESLRPSSPPPPRRPPSAAASRFEGPRGFFWVRPGKLGGLPRPGIIEPVERDLDALQRLGVTALVTLEEDITVDVAALRARGINSVHFPIPDMGVPTLAGAEGFCRCVDALLRDGDVVAVHCRAGLGRTGSVLAYQLIFEGDSARDALERVRRINPSCVQSATQVDFLSAFETFLRSRGHRATSTEG